MQNLRFKLQPGHLACFHTTNTFNYSAHLFPAEVTKQRKVLNQVLKCYEIRIHSHTKYREVFFFYFSDFRKKKNLRTAPALADHINSSPWNKIHNPSQKSLSQELLPDLFLMSGLFWDGLVGALSPFCHSHRGFPAPSPRPTHTLRAGSAMFVCVVGLFYLSCTYSVGLKSSLHCLPG